jgi:hypothetical protein
MGAKTQNDGAQLLVLYWRAGGIHIIKENGAGWLRWLTKQGGVILAHPNHRDNKYALEFPLPDKISLHPSKEPRSC